MVTKVQEFRYMGSTKEVWKRGEEESTGRMEWIEKSVRSDV